MPSRAEEARGSTERSAARTRHRLTRFARSGLRFGKPRTTMASGAARGAWGGVGQARDVRQWANSPQRGPGRGGQAQGSLTGFRAGGPMSPGRWPSLTVMVTATTARRMFELLEPICLVTFFADECNEEMAALGHRTYWDGYFASRAAPLGRVPGRGRARGLLQLRRRRGRAAHPERMGDDPAPRHPSPPGSGPARPRCDGSSATSWPTPPPGARRRPDHQGRDERAHGRPGDVRRDAHPSGAQ